MISSLQDFHAISSLCPYLTYLFEALEANAGTHDSPIQRIGVSGCSAANKTPYSTCSNAQRPSQKKEKKDYESQKLDKTVS